MTTAAKTVTASEFDAAVREAAGPVLVDFSAAWCPPCQMLKPVLGDVAEELSDRLSVVIVDVDDSREIASEFGVRSIPALKLFVNGEVVAEATGFQNHDALLAWIDSALAAAA